MISQAEVAARKNPAAKQVFANSMQTMLKKCNYNPGFLVPHFFPCYPKQQPLSLAARPFSYSMFAMQVGGFTVVRASRQVGKSTSFGARQLMNAHMLPNYRSLYIVPHEEHRKTYANRLREMERAFTYKTHSATHRQNLNYKEYPNGSIIELIRVWTSADESRGKTTDELLFDECQHLDATLLPEIEQTQKASSIPTTIYAGTSLTVDTLLETRWLQSSQGVWMLRGSRGWLNTGDQETVVSMIRRQGLCDPHTGRLLDVRDGEYVHADRRALEDGYVGLHIPQVIIPDMVESPIEWEKIWRAFVEYDRKKFLQEVLGIPTMEGSREITLDDLKGMCVLQDTEAQAIEKCRNRYYKYVVSGCDWGGSDYNPADKTKLSYTVHVILGLTQSGKVDILYMRRYSSMSYREIAGSIMHDHVRFYGNAMATDFGVGAAYNMLIREQMPADKHFILAYTGPRAAPLSAPQGYGWFNQFALNRTESITKLFEAVRQPDPRIRCFNWGRAENFLMDLLNMYRVPVENTSSGAGEFVYRRHGSKADDTLHAINFAYTLLRLAAGEPLVEDRGLFNRIRQQLLGGGSWGLSGGMPGVFAG